MTAKGVAVALQKGGTREDSSDIFLTMLLIHFLIFVCLSQSFIARIYFPTSFKSMF